MKKIIFEEYRKQQEIYSVIDTPEKLEIIRSNYNSYIQSTDDTQYLEPIDSNFRDAFSHKSYYDKLNNLFKYLELENDEIRIIVIPSFEPEYQVRILKDKVLIDRLTGNQWANFYNANLSNKLEVNTSYHELASSSDSRLSYDIIKAIKNSRIPKAKRLVLDGVQYFFLHKSNSELKIAYKHSPDEESNTGILIDRVEKMIRELGEKGGSV